MNRGTINRLRRARTMFCLLLIGCCSMLLSCTQETLDGEMTEPVGGNVELRFKAFDTNATTDPEKAVNRVRVVVFGSYSSTDRGKLICNRYAIPDATGTISPILISAGMRDIYLVVNEPLGTDGTELASYKNIQSYDDLSNLQIPYKGGVGADVIARDGLPMLGCYINRMVRGESNVFGADVEYLMAKVSLTVKDVDGGPSENPTTGDVKVTSMKVCNIPYYNTLMASTYNSKEYYSQALPFTATTEGTTVNNTAEFYLPEHIVKNADSKTYVEVKGENQKTNTISTWIVKLGDATVTTPTPAPAGTPYNITRNMHYTVVGTIKSYGEIEIVMDVQPWNVVNSNGSVGEYLKLSTTTVELLEMDEEVTITYTGPAPTSIIFARAALEDRIETIITNDGVNSGKITFKRKDVVHDGKKYSSLVAIQCSPTVPPTYMLVSIEQYSVNVGGILTTTPDGLRKYWSGGVNWATGDLVVTDWPNFQRMSVSTNPNEVGIFFKWLSEWGGYKQDGPFSDGSGRPNGSIPFNSWNDIPNAGYISPTHENGYYDPCRNAARIPGDTDPSQLREVMYWRYPTRAEVLDLSAEHTPVDGAKRTFRNGRLLVNGEGHLNEHGIMQIDDFGGFYIDAAIDGTTESAYMYQPYSNTIQAGNKGSGFAVRCVVDDYPRITGSNGDMIKTIHVAKHDITYTSWADAMGLEDIYNDQLAPASSVHAFMGYNFTGCKQFGADWRVPTSQEMQNTVWPQREKIVAQGGDPIQLASYATGSQSSATVRFNYDTRHPTLPGGWGPFTTTKRTPALVRCVKSTKL